MDVDNIPNLEFVYNETSSVQLLQWTDVVIDLGSTIAFEAIQRNINVFAMEYLHSQYTTIAHYFKGCVMNCRDDLYESIKLMINDKNILFYTDDEKKRFVEEMIQVKGENVLDEYINFLKNIYV